MTAAPNESEFRDELRAAEARYRTLFEQAPDGILIGDPQSNYLDANPSMCRMLGYTREELIGLNATDILDAAQAGRVSPVIEDIKARTPHHQEWTFKRKDGSLFPGEVMATIMPDGNLLGVVRDITDRTETNAALRRSLAEKQALLKEVHHRVKNNMQVITSLLRLEAKRIDHETTRGVLKEMQNRIQSMAVLHETLYRSENFSSVDLGAYLRLVSGQLARSLALSPGQVALHLDLASVGVELDQVIPCGLIVSELVSNAFKHGFPEGRTGAVSIGLQTKGDLDLVLSVRDNGVGLPADLQGARDKSLGLQLVSDLTRQLRGNLVIGPGSSFEVTFARAPRRDSSEFLRPDG